jgi:peptidoglycan/LPS O-acetylase OafA/YrhL
VLNNHSNSLKSHGGYGPFWSLSVEEQFYLVWPAIVGNVSVRVLTVLSLALCVLEPALRWLNVSYGNLATGVFPLGDVKTATYLVADNLALGALAAIFARSRYGTLSNGIKLGFALCVAGLCLFLAGYPFGILHRSTIVGAALQCVPWNVFFTGLMLLLLGWRSPLFAGKWASPLRFLGYISYGLYLVHAIIFGLYDQILPHASNPSLHQVLESPLVRFPLCAGLSIAIAWLSRKFYEEPFLRMGRKTRSSIPPLVNA